MEPTSGLSIDQTFTGGEGIETNTEQYLTFLLAGEEYGVDILRVQEIKGWDAVTQLPNTPAFIRGVINLRGTIVPIIDLRLRFKLQQLEYGPTTVVIMLRVEGQSGSRIMGIVVDGVSDVYNIPAHELKPSPELGASININYIRGLATVNEKMVIVLDIDCMMSSGEFSRIDAEAGTE